MRALQWLLGAVVAAGVAAQAHAQTIIPLIIVADGMLDSANCPGSLQVVDGDTLRLCGRTIRLEGIDAPELDQPLGDRARDNLAAFLTQATRVSCVGTETDTRGRLIARCTVESGQRDVGAWMVSRGLAAAYHRYSCQYAGLENQAQLQKLGMWQAGIDRPALWRCQQKIGQKCEGLRKRIEWEIASCFGVEHTKERVSHGN